MLLPLVQNFSDVVKVSLYHSPSLRGLLKLLLPERFNETVALTHLKVYLTDDTIIMSGSVISFVSFSPLTDNLISSLSLAWETSQHFVTHSWFPWEMTSEKQVQEFHTDDMSLDAISASTSDWSCHMGNLHQLLNQRHYPDLGIDTTSVWNFCARFSKLFPWETGGSIAKCWLFSQAVLSSSSVDIFLLPSLSALLHPPSILPFSFLFFSHFLPLSSLPLPSSPPLFFSTPSLLSYPLTSHPLPSSHLPFSYPVHFFFPSRALSLSGCF